MLNIFKCRCCRGFKKRLFVGKVSFFEYFSYVNKTCVTCHLNVLCQCLYQQTPPGKVMARISMYILLHLTYLGKEGNKLNLVGCQTLYHLSYSILLTYLVHEFKKARTNTNSYSHSVSALVYYATEYVSRTNSVKLHQVEHISRCLLTAKMQVRSSYLSSNSLCFVTHLLISLI